jgi:hypothetical protein
MSDPTVVYEFEAGRKTIRASVNVYRGTPYLDLREWYEPAPGQPLAPTKKGVSIPRDETVKFGCATATVDADDHSCHTPAHLPPLFLASREEGWAELPGEPALPLPWVPTDLHGSH